MTWFTNARVGTMYATMPFRVEGFRLDDREFREEGLARASRHFDYHCTRIRIEEVSPEGFLLTRPELDYRPRAAPICKRPREFNCPLSQSSYVRPDRILENLVAPRP